MTSTCSVRTTCPYCGVGCGVNITADAEGMAPVQGDPEHPANAGRLCVKGSSLHETMGTHGRLRQPLIKGERVSWDVALAAVASGLQQVKAEQGAGAIGFYLSGQLLTEDYYVANKLAKGFIGTPNLDTNSRLCMSSAVASYKRAFGEDVVPGNYEDLECADLLVFAGANPAWNHPVLYQRMKQAIESEPGRRLVVIDPRRTASCEVADLHLALKPGTDVLLWNGLLVWLADQGALASDYIAQCTRGLSESLAAARRDAPDVASVAAACDLPEADVRRFYQWFADTPRTVSFWSQGMNQSSSGTDKGNALINCHLATGRVGKPGATPFSITGQPNAMGGREVGGLANQLAAHRDYETPGAVDAVQTFWQAPAMAREPGLKAVDLFEAVHSGSVQAVWIMATNPLVSLPDANRVREALARCPLVIVSDCVADSDTLALADIVLPAQGWGEKDGTVTNSERCMSRQRGLMPPVGEARPDWWIISQVAARMGFEEAFDYAGPAAIFREHAALSGWDNAGERAFNISPLAALTDQAYDDLAPVQWPVTGDVSGELCGKARLFGDGHFSTNDGRARFVAVGARLPVDTPSADWPLVVNSGRIRDQWHTMTRTGRAARLLQHHPEPFMEIHPDTLGQYGLADGQLARLTSARGTFLGRVRATDGQRLGEVFVPIHWNDQFTGDGVASRLFDAHTDPVSGQPESKQTCARLSPFQARWQARLLARSEPDMDKAGLFWTRVPYQACEGWYLAGDTDPDWSRQAAHWLGRAPDAVLEDIAARRYRAAWYDGGRLQAVLMVEAVNTFPQLDWLDGLFAQDALDIEDQRQVLAGRSGDLPDTGAIVCSCYQVGELTIRDAIETGQDSVSALGEHLKCGTNCGSCIPELKALIARQPEPAE